MNAMLDINGLYQWDNTIFDDMILPAEINKNTLIDMIIWECRELTITVASPTILKRAIRLWCDKNIYYWNKLSETMHYDYNPIENYNRVEVITDEYTNNGTRSESGTRSVSESGKTTSDESYKKAAYDSATEQPRDLRHTEVTPDTTTTEIPNIINTDNGSGSNKHNAHISGNIGTMSTQTMIEQERSIADISLYNVILNSFKNEFCILKY